MAIGVYCENCAHHEECDRAIRELGIKVYVLGMVDCDNFEEKKKE